jgi:hypothetical protein
VSRDARDQPGRPCHRGSCRAHADAGGCRAQLDPGLHGQPRCPGGHQRRVGAGLRPDGSRRRRRGHDGALERVAGILARQQAGVDTTLRGAVAETR